MRTFRKLASNLSASRSVALVSKGGPIDDAGNTGPGGAVTPSFPPPRWARRHGAHPQSWARGPRRRLGVAVRRVALGGRCRERRQYQKNASLCATYNYCRMHCVSIRLYWRKAKPNSELPAATATYWRPFTE